MQIFIGWKKTQISMTKGNNDMEKKSRTLNDCFWYYIHKTMHIKIYIVI